MNPYYRELHEHLGYCRSCQNGIQCGWAKEVSEYLREEEIATHNETLFNS